MSSQRKCSAAKGRIGKFFSKLHGKRTTAHEIYNADHSYTAKGAYKLRWEKMLLAELTLGKEHTKQHAHVDKKKGVYLNFGLYVESYGIRYNRELAIKRATVATAKCAMMGSSYINKDTLGD